MLQSESPWFSGWEVLVVLWLKHWTAESYKASSDSSRTITSLSDKYPWERYKHSYTPSYGLNSTTTVLLEISSSSSSSASCRASKHEHPWPSVATSPYHSSPLAGLQGYTQYPHIADVCMFELVVLLLLSHMRGSIGVHHLWARPCFSSSVLHVWFV